jgi:hypothetical protein
MRGTSCSPGKPFVPKFSLINIPDVEITHRAERLGVSLGLSEGEVSKSIKGIKLVEEDRILTMLQNNKAEHMSKEHDLSTLVTSKVSTLCEDLVEEDDALLGVEEYAENLKPIVREKKIRQRKVYDTNNIRKSSRKRIKKQFS